MLHFVYRRLTHLGEHTLITMELSVAKCELGCLAYLCSTLTFQGLHRVGVMGRDGQKGQASIM